MTEDIKIRCDDCKFVEDCVDYGWDGCRKFTQKPSEPMTNEEYIRTCSTEELAILLYKIGFYSNITDDVMNTALMENVPTEKAFELWLKEKHDDGKKIVS